MATQDLSTNQGVDGASNCFLDSTWACGCKRRQTGRQAGRQAGRQKNKQIRPLTHTHTQDDNGHRLSLSTTVAALTWPCSCSKILWRLAQCSACASRNIVCLLCGTHHYKGSTMELSLGTPDISALPCIHTCINTNIGIHEHLPQVFTCDRHT